ncbi:hypothetical protein [Lentzea flava]|uniref:Methyltransferase domain-containing protein n=1 Tax=Lentzea flava TaxID=103732 RepID=A0ABQ2VFP7_9PSEU|nr:hypothetical protein [Lentzea flava]MCP2204790.1 hypothetical protein [Lentzea flava]GGU81019.1 hypothetical protein GCM10010178_84650 [Lentzea flava]
MREGTGLIAHWLLTAVIKIVTTYTQPGQRVLLLDPAPFSAAAPASVTGVPGRSHRSHYVGLLEAGWTVVRLGRSVQTQAAVAHPDRIDDTAADTPSKSESASGLPAIGPSTDHSVEPSSDHRHGPDPEATERQPDRFDLIITAAEPHTLDSLRPTDWAGLLTPTGTLAVITHGDRSTGLLNDPAGPLVRSARHAGLRYTDRIALLRVPVRHSALIVASLAVRAHSQSSAGLATAAVRHSQVHGDLIVLTRHSLPAAADGEETSDA